MHHHRLAVWQRGQPVLVADLLLGAAQLVTVLVHVVKQRGAAVTDPVPAAGQAGGRGRKWRSGDGVSDIHTEPAHSR